MVSQNQRLIMAPRFQMASEQPIRPEIIAFASAVMLILLGLSLYVTRFPTHFGRTDASQVIQRSTAGSQAKGGAADGDDPSALDTLVFGDPADPQHHAVRNTYAQVHPTLVGHLQRFGDGPGLIPDTPAGHLLYTWLIAFNGSNSREMSDLLPPGASSLTIEDLLELRSRNGGFNVVAAKETGPDTLSFVLRGENSPDSIFSGRLIMLSASTETTMRSFALKKRAIAMDLRR